MSRWDEMKEAAKDGYEVSRDTFKNIIKGDLGAVVDGGKEIEERSRARQEKDQK